MKFVVSILLFVLSFQIPQHQPAVKKGIDFTQVLVGIDDKPIIPKGETQPMTLGDVCVNALETPTDSDHTMPGADKFKLDQLARKIYQNANADLTVEELATLKDRVGKLWGPLIVGAAWRLLDPAQK